MYAYAGNNPVKYVDPDGRLHGLTSEMRVALENHKKIETDRINSQIEQVKEQLAIILKNSAIVSSYKELGSEDLPEPKSGAIKYLLSAYEYSHTWNSDDPFIISMDYIDGKYHGFYKTLLANNPNK